METASHSRMQKSPKLVAILVGLVLLAAGLVSVWSGDKPSSVTTQSAIGKDSQVEEDRYGRSCRSTGWTNLITTAIPPPNGFFPMPITKQQALAMGYKRIMKCSKYGAPGDVFSLDGVDRLPFFDKDGKIRGVIIGTKKVSRSMRKQGPYTRYRVSKRRVFWGIEFHFRKPKRSFKRKCRRSDKCKPSALVGNGLWVRQKNSRRFIRYPYVENKYRLVKKLGFTQGACVNGMGMHYWKDIQCGSGYPVFLMYTGGKLTAFGVAMNHDPSIFPQTKYWEKRKGLQIAPAFKPGALPKCALDAPFLAMHVFLTNPQTNICPK